MILFLLPLKLFFPSPIILLFSVLLVSHDQLCHAKNWLFVNSKILILLRSQLILPLLCFVQAYTGRIMMHSPIALTWPFLIRSLRNKSPPYIKDLLSLKPATNYALRSSAQSLLFVPKANCSSLGDRALAHAEPVLWNSLPLTIRTSSSLAIFKKQLKTFLFRKAFSLFQ